MWRDRDIQYLCACLCVITETQSQSSLRQTRHVSVRILSYPKNHTHISTHWACDTPSFRVLNLDRQNHFSLLSQDDTQWTLSTSRAIEEGARRGYEHTCGFLTLMIQDGGTMTPAWAPSEHGSSIWCSMKHVTLLWNCKEKKPKKTLLRVVSCAKLAIQTIIHVVPLSVCGALTQLFIRKPKHPECQYLLLLCYLSGVKHKGRGQELAHQRLQFGPRMALESTVWRKAAILDF